MFKIINYGLTRASKIKPIDAFKIKIVLEKLLFYSTIINLLFLLFSANHSHFGENKIDIL